MTVITSSQVNTELGKQYLFKLCKHFARKIPVEFSETEGVAQFGQPERPLGQVEFNADAEHLRFTVRATDEAAARQLQAVVESHLQLMRKAENPALDWQPVAG
ncbi:DUF2218 domain-containing protein [Chitinibacter sp. ZOR0017]|uniref:DUF2218 domain-containing protein n=1 Tax=Chitinibacter sp. ZOR0017 TaxID=1339254 RepID=UPI0006477BDB|nr:DUF2218 domain-containing protein [Chitinibacter sp. ZOR0017]